ncbi:1094_t:CDS:2, partial [Funneliformis caledonium]
DLPSKQKPGNKKKHASDGILVLSKVCDFIRCMNCGKLRCLFSQKMLKEDEQLSIINQTCHDHIEQIYYSCKIQHLPICYFCGEADELVEPDEKSKNEWQTIYPLCNSCQNKGLRWFTK